MENISTSISDICAKYPTLNQENDTQIKGILPIDKVVNDEHIVDSFEIEVDFKEIIPKVKELGNRTERYYHKYKNGNLCLETDFNQLMYLENHTYLEWLDYFVINYFCSFCYYQKYKCYPYGERNHRYGDFFGFAEYMEIHPSQAWSILEYIVNKKYRGHDLCPCGSGKRIRNCHKDVVLRFKKDNDVYKSLKKLYEKTKGEILENEKVKQSKKKYL